MSRYETTATLPSGQLAEAAYGFDEAFGYFIQIFDPSDPDGGDEEVSLIVDEDSLFTDLSNYKLLALLNQYHIVIPKSHRDKIGGDWPI